MKQETTDTAAMPGKPTQKQALLEAFDTVLKKQAEDREAELRDAEARRRGRSGIRPAIWASALLVGVLCTYLYMERPDWLFPTATPHESVAVTEASLRIGMANVAQHVERYRQRTGRLPRTLLDAGTQAEGIAYEPLDSAGWRLVGSYAGLELTLVSQEPLDKFIGKSFDLISRRTP